MSHPNSANRLARFFDLLADGGHRLGDWRELKELLDRHPELVRMRLPNGKLPLRALLDGGWPPGHFQRLIQHGAEHDIITAAAATDLPAIERLLDQDPQLVHDTDAEGNTPLHWACGQTRYSKQPSDTIGLVERLLAAGSDVNARNVHGHAPLDRHFLDGSGEVCESLFEHGATLNVLYGVMAEDFEFLDELLESEPDQVHWRDPRDGASLLHLAVRWECELETFEYLLARGARDQLESQCGRTSWTPLLQAIQIGNYEAAEVLIRNGADVNARENRVGSDWLWDWNAVFLAVRRDRVGLAEMLIAHGADVHDRGPRGTTLLCFARSLEMAELLLGKEIDPVTPDTHGRTPMDHAIEEGHRDVALTLVRHGVPPTFFSYVSLGDCEQVLRMLDHDPALILAYNKPARGSPMPPSNEEDPPDVEDAVEIPWGSACGTALHYAVKSGVLCMVNLLLDRGAEVNAVTDPAKWTPVHDATYYTIMRDFREGEAIIRALVLAGADLHARTWGEYRPVDIADYLSFEDRSADVFDLLTNLVREQSGRSRSGTPK